MLHVRSHRLLTLSLVCPRPPPSYEFVFFIHFFGDVALFAFLSSQVFLTCLHHRCLALYRRRKEKLNNRTNIALFHALLPFLLLPLLPRAGEADAERPLELADQLGVGDGLPTLVFAHDLRFLVDLLMVMVLLVMLTDGDIHVGDGDDDVDGDGEGDRHTRRRRPVTEKVVERGTRERRDGDSDGGGLMRTRIYFVWEAGGFGMRNITMERRSNLGEIRKPRKGHGLP